MSTKYTMPTKEEESKFLLNEMIKDESVYYQEEEEDDEDGMSEFTFYNKK